MEIPKESIDVLSMILGDEQKNIIQRLDKNKKLADIIFQFNKDFRVEIHNVYSDNLGEVIPQIMIAISIFLEGFDKETKRLILLSVLESLDSVEKKVKEFHKLSKDV